MDLTQLDQVIDRYSQESAQIVPILQDVQRRQRYLREEGLIYIAQRLHIPLSRVYAVATFYGAFSLKPLGRHVISVCTGTACHLRGAPKLLDVLHGKFELSDGRTSTDGRFTLKRVNCLGACALAPVVVIDGVYFDGMTPDKLLKAVKKFP